MSKRHHQSTPNAERLAALQAELVEIKLAIEKAKLAKLEAELPNTPDPRYTRFEDLPPPTPEDRARFHARFMKLYAQVTREPDTEPNPPSE